MTVATVASAVDRYVSEFETQSATASARAAGESPPWLVAARRDAIAKFAAAGFPTTRQEEWRFTSVSAIAETPYVSAPSGVSLDAMRVRALEICEAHRHLLVFVNGRFAPELSSVEGLPQGVVIGSLRDAFVSHAELIARHMGRPTAAARTSLSWLNTAFATDGAFVYLPPNVEMEEPVQLLYLSSPNGAPTVSHPRSLIIADRLSRLSLVETYGCACAPGASYWTNAVTEIVALDGARIDAYRVQREGERAHHTAATYSEQGRDSMVTIHPVVFGAALSRHDIVTRLAGQNGHCTINGLYILGDTQHADHHTTIDHAEPHCESHEYMNGVLDGQSRGVFNGRIIVRPGAQRTDSKQTNNNLVLSEHARADSQPQLEIYADDVKCTHGATLGPIDPTAMFYLTSRGITPTEARSLLTYGFGAEIIDRMEIAPLQAQLDRLVRQRILGRVSS
jgi:Fe-S cluster assembly protein SufD